MGGTVFRSGGCADAEGCGVAGGVEDVGEQGTVGLPPLLVRDAGVGLGLGCFDGSMCSAADVVVQEADDEVHVDVGEAEPVHGGEFFIVAPQVLFLDEPTTGLDPHGRNEVWQSIRALASAGTTVLLTTQYLEEADQLADAITVLAAGRAVAAGSPDELKSLTGGDRIDVVLRDVGDVTAAATLLQARLGTDVSLDHDSRKVSMPVTDRLAALTEIIRSLQDENITVEDIIVRRPTLDEAFLQLTRQQAPPGDTASNPSGQPAEVSTP